eukprot:jgi/Botrbrau1/23124/Bobra.0243s0054.1
MGFLYGLKSQNLILFCSQAHIYKDTVAHECMLKPLARGPASFGAGHILDQHSIWLGLAICMLINNTSWSRQRHQLYAYTL